MQKAGTASETVVLGVSSGFHDAATALVIDGVVVAAVEEERLSRQKHDASFPGRSIDCCLAIVDLTANDIDVVAYHEKPVDIIQRHLRSRIRSGPAAAPGLLLRTPATLGKQLAVGHRIDRWFRERGAVSPPVAFAEHHASHAAASFYPSPFDRAAVLTVDGVGEWATAGIAHGNGASMRSLREMQYPDSVGLLYSAFTEYCGFRVNGGEGELMGLAAYGEPTSAGKITERLVTVNDDGSIKLDQTYFDFTRGRRMTNRRFHRLLGGPPRPLGLQPTQREADLAASVQHAVEQILLAMAREAHRLTGERSLCMAGGVALNCVANRRLLDDTPFDEIWVQPAAGDSGNALGAALWAWHDVLEHPRPAGRSDSMAGAFLGPSFPDDEVATWLREEGVDFRTESEECELLDTVVDALADGKVVGWFQGRMEFGPRALGHRSILADPRPAEVQRRINLNIKKRAAFRPFAPAILASELERWFDASGDFPYMTITSLLLPNRRLPAGAPPSRPPGVDGSAPSSEIPAVTHVDHSARVQTVDADRNPEFAALLEAWFARTGCPVLLNTSFNGPDEPIVCTPEDAVLSSRSLGLDLLVLGPHVVTPTSC